MARIFELDSPSSSEQVKKDLTRSLQSAHINFLIGSGASVPAVPLAGTVEKDVEELSLAGKHDEAALRLYDLISNIQTPTNALIAGTHDAPVTATLEGYTSFLRTIETILIERRTTILPKQATLFTTNYDMFIDVAARNCSSAIVATGFNRVPLPDQNAEYSPSRFFLATFDTGNFYDYRVELPTINLIKLHGCLSWQRTTDGITLRAATCDLPKVATDANVVRDFIKRYAVVLPQAAKLNTTVLDRTYYDLLRIYANSLDKENALLVAAGFSFRDEHLLDITRRALKNPTLRLVVTAFDDASRAWFAATFAAHNNVVIIANSAGKPLEFTAVNDLLRSCVPSRGDV